MRWNQSTFFWLPFVALGNGILASLVGIGGGLILSTYLISVGVHSEVVSATSASLILFTSSSTTLQYAIMGYLKLDYSLIFFTLSFFSFILGKFVINYYITKYRRTSLVILAISLVSWISAILMGITSLTNLFSKDSGTKELGITAFCESGH